MTDWQGILDEHGPAVWRTITRLLRDPADAADCMQEALVAAVQVARHKPVVSWRALLIHLATCKAIDAVRRRIRRRARWADVDASRLPGRGPSPDAAAVAGELSDRLVRSLAELPPQWSQAFCLRVLDELSYEQIAAQMETTTSHVGVLLHRARARLRELLESARVVEPHEVPK